MASNMARDLPTTWLGERHADPAVPAVVRSFHKMYLCSKIQSELQRLGSILFVPVAVRVRWHSLTSPIRAYILLCCVAKHSGRFSLREPQLVLRQLDLAYMAIILEILNIILRSMCSTDGLSWFQT